MSKPFGKPSHHGLGLTKGLRFTIALWIAAVPAYFLCGSAESYYPTLSSAPFFWPAAWVFAFFYAAAIALWLKRRPSPRAPGTSSSAGLFIGRFFLALLLAFPAGLASAYLYEPALKTANALGSPAARVVEHALVHRVDGLWVLDSPYWPHDYKWTVKSRIPFPADLTPGSLAKITFRRGLLGARWIESVDYTVLK